jgi:hypothetical protein
MTSSIKRLAHDAAEPFERMGAPLLRRGVLLISAITFLVVSLVFFTTALYDFLRTLTEPEIATLSVGVIYLCTAVILLVFTGTGTHEVPDPGQGSHGSLSIIKSAVEQKGSKEFSRQVDGIVAPVLNALRDTGLERERAMLVAGSAIIKEVTPLTGVAFAIVIGLVVGQRLRKRR